MKRKSTWLFALLFILASPLSSQEIHHSPWELVIYRPLNKGDINDVRCYLVLEDAQTGEIVTKTALRKASYQYTSDLNTAYFYQRDPYLCGDMMMILNIKPGKYWISLWTPKDKAAFLENPKPRRDWNSNRLYYNTDNPIKALFVRPTKNDNGFYDGSWEISTKAPQFWKWTK